jgi:hypothetical protein
MRSYLKKTQHKKKDWQSGSKCWPEFKLYHHQKKKRVIFRAKDVAQVVKQLPSKNEALGSNPSTVNVSKEYFQKT